MTEAQKSIVVITKIDKASSYAECTQNNYAGFIESLKGQIVTIHNSLIGILKDTQRKRIRTGYKIDKKQMQEAYLNHLIILIYRK